MSLQEIETSLTQSLTTITTHWDAMLTPRSSGGIAKAPTGAVTLADDHSDTDADTPRLERLLSLRREVMDCLNAWSRVIIEDRDVRVQVPHGTDVPGMCVFLTRHAQWFAGHEAAEEADTELRAWAGKVRNAADPTRKDWVNLGPCPVAINDDITCGTTIRAYPHKAHTDTITCRGCGFENDLGWWVEVIVGAEELVTIPQLAEILRRRWGTTVTERTLRNWHKNGRIRAAETGPTPKFDRQQVFRDLAAHEKLTTFA